MSRGSLRSILAFHVAILLAVVPASAAGLTVELSNAQGVTFVGALNRWDRNGNHRSKHLPDPKAKIDAPAVDAKAVEKSPGLWVFKDLPEGKYDLVILTSDRRRFEGFQYVPVKEFDPFFAQDASVDDEVRATILDDLKKSPHYENKVEPLYLGGDEKAVRVLVALTRDKPTSYEADSPGAATVRHEIWQYSFSYGAWKKEKRTKVLDRILMPRDELRRWTWRWDPKLGGIEVGSQPITVKYDLPKAKSGKSNADR